MDQNFLVNSLLFYLKTSTFTFTRVRTELFSYRSNGVCWTSVRLLCVVCVGFVGSMLWSCHEAAKGCQMNKSRLAYATPTRCLSESLATNGVHAPAIWKTQGLLHSSGPVLGLMHECRSIPFTPHRLARPRRGPWLAVLGGGCLGAFAAAPG